MAGEAARFLDHLFGGAGGDDFAPFDAALGTEVDYVIRRLDDIEIMLDHDHAVALVDQRVEDFQ